MHKNQGLPILKNQLLRRSRWEETSQEQVQKSVVYDYRLLETLYIFSYSELITMAGSTIVLLVEASLDVKKLSIFPRRLYPESC